MTMNENCLLRDTIVFIFLKSVGSYPVLPYDLWHCCWLLLICCSNVLKSVAVYGIDYYKSVLQNTTVSFLTLHDKMKLMSQKV